MLLRVRRGEHEQVGAALSPAGDRLAVLTVDSGSWETVLAQAAASLGLPCEHFQRLAGVVARYSFTPLVA